MHTVWKGAISFGLVHVPVKMFSATEDKDISLRYIHKECGSPLSYVRKCPVCDKEVAQKKSAKAMSMRRESLSSSTKRTWISLPRRAAKASPF